MIVAVVSSMVAIVAKLAGKEGGRVRKAPSDQKPMQKRMMGGSQQTEKRRN